MTTKRPSPRARCEGRYEDLWRSLDGELPATQAARLARHVATCAVCRRLTPKIRLAMDICRHLSTRQVPAEVRARARARTRQLLDPAPHRTKKSRTTRR